MVGFGYIEASHGRTAQVLSRWGYRTVWIKGPVFMLRLRIWEHFRSRMSRDSMRCESD
jgi:hypothetical protein